MFDIRRDIDTADSGGDMDGPIELDKSPGRLLRHVLQLPHASNNNLNMINYNEGNDDYLPECYTCITYRIDPVFCDDTIVLQTNWRRSLSIRRATYGSWWRGR
jgi:hypothetical protein